MAEVREGEGGKERQWGEAGKRDGRSEAETVCGEGRRQGVSVRR